MARVMCPHCKVRVKTSVGYCRPCNTARMKDYRIARKAKFRSGELQHPATKQCRVCGVIKKADDFSFYYSVRDGLKNECKSCVARLTNIINKKTRYGLSGKDIAQRLAEQGSRCAICRYEFDVKAKRSFHIDHDHSTGAVRGLLCITCNFALGLLGDDLKRVELAIVYLQRTS